MKLRKFLLALLLVALGIIGWAVWPREASLRRFDPKIIAQAETDAWRHYYANDWPALANDLCFGARRSYGFSPWRSTVIGWHAAEAARVFRTSHSRDEAMHALPELRLYFRSIQDGIDERFDVNESARLELEWWQLRREHQTWQEYGIAVSRATAMLYGSPHEPFDAACLKRSEMMHYRDQRGQKMTDADWQHIHDGLLEAWTKLGEIVRR